MKSKLNLSVLIMLCSMLISRCTSYPLKAECSQGYVQVQNAKIFYQTLGEDYPILVVDGGSGLDQTYLQHQLFQLSDKHQRYII